MSAQRNQETGALARGPGLAWPVGTEVEGGARVPTALGADPAGPCPSERAGPMLHRARPLFLLRRRDTGGGGGDRHRAARTPRPPMGPRAGGVNGVHQAETEPRGG